MKRVGIVALLVLGTLVVIVSIAFILLDAIARLRIEQLGTSALQVPVKLRSADLRLAGGLSLDRLDIANPPGFEEAQALHIDRLDVAADTRSVFRPVVEIRELVIRKPTLVIEFGRKGSNWSALMKNLTGKVEEERRKEQEKGKPAGPEKRFRIRRLRIEDATVRFRSKKLPGDDKASIHLKKIELKNIGTAPGTASTTKTVVAIILQAIGASSVKEGTGVPKELMGTFKDELKGTEKLLEGLLEK